jgi:hypothetical protein
MHAPPLNPSFRRHIDCDDPGGIDHHRDHRADAHGWRLDRALAGALPSLSRERLKALISSGR